MIWQLIISPGAERDFNTLPKPDKQRIKDDLYARADRIQPRRDLKKLKGNRYLPIYSLIVSQYHIILSLNNDVMVIFVIEMGKRNSPLS